MAQVGTFVAETRTLVPARKFPRQDAARFCEI
jgi:hypothetical protein